MISVVIPAYNEEKYISGCLHSLTRQTTSRPFEIIVVDNSSTDKTAHIVQAFQSKIPLRLIHEPTKGRGPARHAGCMAASGDILLSTDADCSVPPDWIDIMAANFDDPAIVGITGTCYITDRSWISNRIFNVIQPAVTILHRLMFGNYWICGSNGGMRKDAYMKTGGFQTIWNSQEDTRLSERIKKFGSIRYVRASKVHTSGRRFKHSIILGLLEYVRSFFERHILRRENVRLDDVR